MSTPLQREGTWTTSLSLAVNVVLAGAKLSVGVIASSQALIADGIHSLVDIASDIAAIVGLRFSHLPKDDDHPYGHHRFSTLATMLISSLVLIFCVGLAWQSLAALVSGVDVVQPGLAAAWVAGAALIIKEGFYQYARRQAERLGSRLLMANATDHRADAIASLLAMVGGVGHEEAGAKTFGLTARVLVETFFDQQGAAGNPGGGETRLGDVGTTDERGKRLPGQSKTEE